MNLNKIGQKNVVTVTKETSLEDAARLMRENHVGDVVVVEKRGERKHPVGILTDRDIVMATIALGASPQPFLVGDLMTAGVATIRENEGISRAIELMKEHGVKRVPVVGKEQELVGIVALEDLVSLLASELSALAEVGKHQKEVELERRRKFT